MNKGKCNCITCKHVAEMRKLIPDEVLCNKVMAVTDGLFDGMAGECIDKDRKISDLKINLDIACNGLKDKGKKIRELKKAIEGLIKATEILREGMLDNLD